MVFGSTIDLLPPNMGNPVHYQDTLPDNIKSLLPARVAGRIMKTTMRNGDFTLPLARLHTAHYGEISPDRVAPPGAPV